MSADFYGLSTGRVESKHLRLDYLIDAGPRIVRLSLAGSEENLLAELPNVTESTPVGDYFLRGGHRLWHGPEAMPRSYAPDNDPVEVEKLANGVRLVQQPEESTGIRKSIEVHLHPDQPAVTLHHHLQNTGPWTVQLAPWAITQLPLGGLAILPQTTETLDGAGLGPNRNFVIWPYSHWQDPRLHLDDDFILMNAEPRMPPCKVGYLNRNGWVAYLRHGVLFVKRFESRPALPHADFGCNAEFYCNDKFIEVETLAPLAQVGPGQTAEHVETWELHAGITVPQTLEGVRAAVQPLGLT